MNLKCAILFIILIEVATKHFVKGLQCYVCENCKDEDFKELHICGEIPVVMTTTPVAQPELVDGSTTTSRQQVKRTSVTPSSSKAPEKPTVDDYLYEDSDERYDAQHFNQKNATRKVTTQASTTSGFKNGSREILSSTQRPTILTETSTKTTTQSSASATSNALNTLTKSATASAALTTTTTKPKPDYDDYLEYDDLLQKSKSEMESLLKINEPVCYTIRYHANNTIFTNRGCTTFINANKYLTCQSLYNGAPMESCRVCSSNGCNKLLDDVGHEDDYGVLFNAAAALQHFGVSVLLLWILIFSQTVA